MKLAERQQQFMTRLISTDGEAVEPSFDERGTAVYLNNYRTSLIDALRDIFGRTLAYAGPEGFERAAVHHLVTSPSTSWSLDHIGTGFPDTLRNLFLADAEVAELAGLELAMHEVFVAANSLSETLERFGERAAAFSDDDWIDMNIPIVPSMRIVPCEYDLISWWNDRDSAPARLPAPKFALVWREEETPVFVLIGELEKHALEAAAQGETFGALCDLAAARTETEDEASLVAGLLRTWMERGLVSEGQDRPTMHDARGFPDG